MTYQTDKKLLLVRKMLSSNIRKCFLPHLPHSKHLKVCGKYFTEHVACNSLLCVWKFGIKQFVLFDILHKYQQR